MTIALVNSYNAGFVSNTSTTFTYNITAVAAGNALIMQIHCDAVVTGVQTNLGQALTADYADSANNHYFYSLLNISGGPTSFTVTTATTPSNLEPITQEYSGVATTSALSTTGNQTMAYSTSWTLNMTTLTANELVVALESFRSIATAPGANFINGLTVAYVLYTPNAGAAAAQSFTFTGASPANGVMGYVSYKAAAASSGIPSASSKRFNSTRHSFGLSR